jgi:alkyl hydroperoxide reductase subunit AhpC
MSLRLGDIAPNFTQDSTTGPLTLYRYAGDDWVVLFSHPRDFTPVCTTELGYLAGIVPAFEERGVKVIGLSIDLVGDHVKWAYDIEDTQGHALNYPLIADHDRKVAALYDMIHPNADEMLTVRSVFVIDPRRRIRALVTYPASTGRNFDEILRVIDSLRLTDAHAVATPANWKPGDDVIIDPELSNEDAKRVFPNGWDERKPYLRIVPQPR